VSAANCGRGQCAEILDSGRRCVQARYRDSDYCYYHAKLTCRLTHRYVPEPATVTTKKAKVAS
jgi:hypothetical protein